MIDDGSGGGLGGNYTEGGCDRDGFMGGKYGDDGGGRLINLLII